MNKQWIFVAAAIMVVGMAAIQSMRAGVASEPLAAGQAISPFEMMLNARDLPVQTIKDPI